MPGPSALVTALSGAGLPTDRFLFEGFLPPRQAARRQRLQALRGQGVTLVFYEASHRIVDSLADMMDVLGPARSAVVARELTKAYETIRAGTLAELLDWLRSDTNQQKGEFVVLVQGVAADPGQIDAAARHALEVLLGELPLRQAAALAARITGVSKNRLYDYGLGLKKPG